MTKDNFCEELDPISNYFVVTSQSRLKNLIGAATLLKGNIDDVAARSALRKTVSRFPQFRSRVRVKRGRWLYRMVLEPDPDHSIELDITTLNHSLAQKPLAHVIRKCVEPTLEEDWDPFDRVLTEFRLIRIHNELHVLIVVLNHVIADPWTLASFGRELAQNYAAATLRSKPGWSAQSHATSALKSARLNYYRARREQSQTNNAVPATRAVSGVLRLALGIIRTFLTVRPGGATGNRGEDGSIDSQARRQLSPEETARLSGVSSMLGVSLTDRLIWASNLAVDKWNAMQERSPHTIHTCVTVQMRGRQRSSTVSSNVSALLLKSEPEERSDRKGFLISIARRRARKLRDSEDCALRSLATAAYHALRVLPPRIAAKFMRVLAQKRVFSVCISDIGIVWPEMQGAKFTGDSYLSQAGGLEVVEMHGFAQGMAVFSDMLLVTYIFRNRLNVVLNTNPEVYTRHQTETLADLIVDNLKTLVRHDSR